MAEALTQQQKIDYAALADEIYVRSDLDQAFTINEINPGFSDIAPDVLNTGPLNVAAAGLRRIGDYYYSDNGFVARVIRDGDKYIVVFRGTDAAGFNDFDNLDMGNNFALVGKGDGALWEKTEPYFSQFYVSARQVPDFADAPSGPRDSEMRRRQT